MHSHVAIRRQRRLLRCSSLLCVGAGKVEGRGEGVWQLGKAKLFSMHALKGVQCFCVVLENICPQRISYILLSLTLRLAKLFDKLLSMLAQRPRGKMVVVVSDWALTPHLTHLPPSFLSFFLIPSRGCCKCNYNYFFVCATRRLPKGATCQLVNSCCPTRIVQLEYSKNSLGRTAAKHVRS